jgi:diguanylate cyclase (GGDEF)-like protein
MEQLLVETFRREHEEPALRDVRSLIHDRDAARESAQRWERLATTDALTGLPNRLAVTEELEKMVRQEPDTTAAMFVDLDGLKATNDAEGHAAGDALIIKVADVLHSSIRTHKDPERPQDIEVRPARLAGDEFLLIFRGVQSQSELTAINNRIIDSLDRENIAASTGAALHEDGQTAAELIDLADKAMYQNKQERKSARKEALRRQRLGAMSVEEVAKAQEARRLLSEISMTGTELDDVFPAEDEQA